MKHKYTLEEQTIINDFRKRFLRQRFWKDTLKDMGLCAGIGALFILAWDSVDYALLGKLPKYMTYVSACHDEEE